MEAMLSEEQTKEIYNLLMEIHDALKDKSTNENAGKISVIEIAWLNAIDELLEKMNCNIPDN